MSAPGQAAGEEVLKACPHCDAPARFVWGHGDTGKVKCTRPSCGATGGSFCHKQNAIAAWNQRTPDPESLSRQLAEARADERNAIRDYLNACSAEANRQRLNFARTGNKLTARSCADESKAYANAAAMIEQDDHASHRRARAFVEGQSDG